MVEDQGFVISSLNPQYALSSQHYFTLTPLWSYNVPVCTLVSWVSYSTAQHVKQAFKEMMNACEIDMQCVGVILRDNVRNMKKADVADDIEVPSMGCISHTLQLAVHEDLLTQCSVTDSPTNTMKVVGQCCNRICRIGKSHMNVYTLFQQNLKKKKKNYQGTAWMQVLFFLMQLYYPGKY